jgi:putative flippase GtrA
MGFVLQTLVLVLLTSALGLHHAVAMAAAVGAAVLHNSAWHDRWTWADRPVRGLWPRLRRLIELAGVTALVSVVGGVALTVVLVDVFAVPVLFANVLTVLSLGAANYVAADRGVMRQRHAGTEQCGHGGFLSLVGRSPLPSPSAPVRQIRRC